MFSTKNDREDGNKMTDVNKPNGGAEIAAEMADAPSDSGEVNL